MFLWRLGLGLICFAPVMEKTVSILDAYLLMAMVAYGYGPNFLGISP